MKRIRTKNINKSDNLWRILVAVLGCVFLFCIVTYLVTPIFMFHPNKDEEAAAFLETKIRSDQSGYSLSHINISGRNELTGYLLDDADSERLLVYFYGIDDDAASSMLYFLDNMDLTYADIDIAVIDWPSYGDSHGSLSDDSMRTAACDIVNTFLRSYGEICIMGYSLGTGPAIYAASVCGCSDLILISPYYSAADLYNSVIPIFYGPLKGLAGFKMDSYAYAENIYNNTKGACPEPLIIASEDDRRVPYESSLRLSECFPEGCRFVSFSGIGHGAIPDDPGVLELIAENIQN